MCLGGTAFAQTLTQVEYRLAGAALTVSPTALTVPRGIPTQLNTSVGGAQTLPPAASIHATLRGPSFPNGMPLVAAPGQPILLPAFPAPGLHFVEDIAMDLGTGSTVAASPAAVTVNVLDELLVGAVSSRPLTLDEIRALGIQFDESSFQAFSFTIAMTTASGIVNIEFPVLVPLVPNQRMLVGGDIPMLRPPQLPALQLPNFAIEAISLDPIDDLPPGVRPPSITGILVIPGTVAFLNQFYSVMLTVTNQAPDGTPLVVRDLRATIGLPAGADGVAGDITRDPPFTPGEPEFDNPLRLARTAAGRHRIRPILAPGADGAPGTADDVDRLGPQGSGSAEFLVEGVREGGHVIDIEMSGILEGLPGGPVEVRGRTSGSVVVRDPTFSLTFIHPNTVRAGEAYDLIVQIQNTSQVAANLVTVRLDPRNLTGARLLNAADASRVIDTIPAGDSGSVTFRLEALRTGKVTATTMEIAGDEGAVTGRRFSLRAGVGELGTPLSPDTLLLPPSVGSLRARAGNDDLTFRAIALLGEAHSIATSPRGSLPAGILPLAPADVIQRALELSEAGLRLELSLRDDGDGVAEPLPGGLLLTLQDLYFDFLGAGVFDDAWDALYRRSRQARLFGSAVADVASREAAALGIGGLVALQRHWAGTESYRDHATAMVQSAGGGALPVTIAMADRLGRRLGGSLDPLGGVRDVPGADVITFQPLDVATAQLVALTRLDAGPYTATLHGTMAGSFDLGIVVPGATGLRHVVFGGVPVTPGELLTLTLRPRATQAVRLERGGVAIAATADELVPDAPPEVLGIVQRTDENIDKFGRVVAVLFSEDVDTASAENAAAYAVGSASISVVPPPAITDLNHVNAARSQFGSRIVFLGLRDPVGPFVPRRLSLSGVRDLRGQTMQPVADRLILPDPNIGTGAVVTGRVLRSGAFGGGGGGALVSYIQLIQDPLGRLVEHIISVKPADEDGRYAFDFVLQNSDGPFILRARDPSTDEQASLTTRVRADGERLTLDLVLLGRGTVEGTVRDRNGATIAGAFVTVRSLTDFSAQQVQTDQHGFYRVTGVPVGAVGLEAIATAGQARASGLILASGRTTTVDVVIFGATPGVVTGEVRLPSGAPAAGISVYLAPGEGSILGGSSGSALDAGQASDTGSFRFESVAPGEYVAIAIDQAFGLAGQARFSVTALNSTANPAFVLVLLSGTGSVSGRVLEVVGGAAVPVPGALVAGGTEIVTADNEGRYLIPAVPVGVRTIDAANPATGAQGSRQVTILAAGQASSGIDIVLNALARVTGQVVDAGGVPVAGQEVRLVVGETIVGTGRRFFVRRTTTAVDGSYAFDRLEPREYPIAAVRGDEVANGRARLAPLVLQDVVNLRFVRGAGRVSGRVVDDTGLAVAARVAIRARVPNAAGILELTNAGTTTSDPDRGFTFTGLFPGPFTLDASSFFSPDTATASGVLSEASPVADNVTLTLARNTGRLRGCVLTPEGTIITPVLDETGVPRPLSVFITSRLLRNELEGDGNPEPDGIRVDASTGCFVSSIPLPPDFYTIQVTDDRPGSPTLGLTGQATATVERGADTIQDVRVLGPGAIGVEVVDATGNPLRGVRITARRTSYPNDVRDALVLAPTVGAPFVFDGITEGAIVVMAVVSTDPAVDVGGREELRGFGGSATGEVVRGASTVIRVTVDAAGTVSGRFMRTAGAGLVPNAQVTLSSATGDTLFAVTDAAGAFRFDGIAVGPFTLDGFEPASGRRARARGEVRIDGQHVVLDLELGPIGRVHGVVVDVTRTQPIAGADVRLLIPEEGERAVTSRLDGTFSFESVPGGTFTIIAASSDGLAGRADVTIAAEGDDIEVLVALEGSGRIVGTVRSAAGIPVAAADVTLVASSGARRTIQAGAAGPGAGTFAFDVVPLGSFTVEARPPGALTPGDGGRITGMVDTTDQVVPADITFQGTIAVGATVTGTSGPAPVDVRLQSTGLFGGTMFPTTVEDGVFLFEGVPRAALTVSARQVAPSGATLSASVARTESELPAAGQRLAPDVVLSLSQVATVTGLVSGENGQPAALARVTLTSTQLTIVGVTAADGRFEFVGVPLSAPLALAVEGPAGGRAVFAGTIDSEGVTRDSQGQPLATIALTLDETPPRVQTTSPLPGATAVSSGSAIVISFSEPVDPASVSACPAGGPGGPSIRLLESGALPPDPNDPLDLCDDSNVVPVSSAISPDGTTVTLTPQRALASVTQHTLALSRGTVDGEGTPIGGIRDLVGLHLATDVIAQFVTIDDVSPRVLLTSPAHGSVDVPEESVVRITFSEPIAAASVTPASIVLSGPDGPLAVSRDLILGNTVVVLTPTDGAGNRRLLASNTTCTLAVGGVADLAGNVQRPQDAVAAVFGTRDTIPPVVASIDAPAAARAGQVITIVARSAALDVASVELFVDGALAAIVSTPSAPGEVTTTLEMPAHAIQIAARATDASGNTGPMSAAVTVALVPDDPPSLSIAAPPAGTTAAAGTTVRFVVRAADDVAVAGIRGATSGAVTTTATRIVTPPATPAEASFDVAIPTAAAGGTVTFAAVAIDTVGQTSPTASVNVTVQAAAPRVTSVSPPVGRQSETLDVLVGAQFTSFVQNVTTAGFGADITVNSVTVHGPTGASVNVTIDEGAATGSRTVTMTTGGEIAVLVGGFTVQPGQAALAPVNPVVGEQGQNLTVVLTGRFTSFVQGVTTASFGPGIGVGTVTVNGPTLASVPITISTAAGTGPRTVTVVTGGEVAALVNGFTVLPGTAAIAVIDPNTGRTNQNVAVNVTGVFTNWVNGVTTASFGPDISVGGAAEGEFGPVTVTSATTLTADLAIDASAPLGPRHVMVRTGSETLTVVGGFTVTEVDTARPGVLTTSPADGAPDIPLNTEVVVEFNEPVDRTTVTTGNTGSFVLVDSVTGAAVPAAVTVDAAGRVATLVPTELLAVNRGFTVFLSFNAFIRDTSGNTLPRFAFSFGTGFATDTTGPALVEASPPDGDSGVPLNASVMLRFSRSINPISRQAGLRVALGSEPVPGTYVFSDANRVVTFTPASPLAADTRHTVSLGADLRDVAGNSLTNPGSFDFTTGTDADVSAPAIAATNPVVEDQGVGRNAVVRVRFSEPVNPLTLVLRLHHAATFQTQAASVAVAADRLSATLTPLAPLLPDTRYLAGVFATDRAGNVAALNWRFTTSADVDVTAPVVTSRTPADDAAGVPVNARVTVRLSEPIDRTSVDAGAVVLIPAVAGTVALAADRVTLVFTPALALTPATAYLVTTSGLRDVAGNTMTPVGTRFTTSVDPAPDTIAPIVTAVTPSHGDTGVPVNAPIVITVSEPIPAGAVHDASVPVFALVGGAFIQVAGTCTIDPAHTQITFTPLAPYPGGTSIWVNVNNDGTIADAAGNLLVFAQVVFTTAATADTTAPTVTSVTPLDGATGVGLNTTAVLTFSEPLHPSTVHAGTFALFAGATLLGTEVNRSADNRTVLLTAALPPSTRVTLVATGGVTDLSGNQLIDFVSTFTTGPAVDTGTPLVVTQRPGSGATQVPATTTITLYANEPLDAATATAALRVSQNGTLVAGSVTITGNGTALQFTPAAPFAAGALVQVFLDATATDLFGNALQAFFGQFTIAPDTTATAPQPVRINPAQTIGLPRNVVFDLEFNEPLDAATVDATTVRLVDAASTAIESVVGLRGDRTIRLVPAAPLDASAQYVFTVTSGVRDRQGTAMTSDFNFGVATGAIIDATPPAPAAVTPPAGAANVGTNALVRVSFSEPINPLTVSGSTIRVSGGSLTLMPASISFNSTNTEVTITPLEAMPDATDMSIAIAGVEDWAGNPVPPQTTVFTTRLGADTAAPAVVETSIADGQIDVPVNTVFTIRFSEPMDSQSVSAASIVLVDHITGNVPAVVSLSADLRTVTLGPTSALSVGRGHSLVMSARDLAGNALPFTGFFTHSFSTAFAGDATPPQVVVVSPAEGDIAVPTNARIDVLFDEPVQRTSLGQVALMAGASAVPITPALSNGNRTLSLVPDGLLAANTAYTVSIASARDTSGNLQTSPVAVTFTTGPGIDLAAPAVTAANPPPGDTHAGRNVVIRVQFSERMSPMSVNAATFLLRHHATSQLQRATVALAADRMSATLTPDAPLLPATRYGVSINAFDVAGFVAGSGWTFITGDDTDTTAPTVASQTPADGATGVPVNARVVTRLSEPIDRTSIDVHAVTLTPAVAGTVTLAPDRVTLTFTPAAALATATTYVVTVGGLRDVTGNTMTPAVTGFTTGGDVTADTIAPTVTNVTPAHGAAGVAVTAPIVITVGEPIRAGAVHDASVPVFALVGGTTFVQIAASYAVDATQTQITVTPIAPYPGSTSIWVNVNNDAAIADAAGNPLVFTQVVFTTAATADATAPTVTSVTPLDGATGVGPSSTMVLTFSEPLDPASVHTGTVALFAGTTQLSLLELNRSADNRTVFLAASLPASTRITVVALGGLTDLSGNQLIDFVSAFTTGPAVDAVSPMIVTMRPGSGATAVPGGTTITLFANEALAPATVSGALRVSENGVPVAGTVTVTGNGTAVRFTPLAPFAPGALVHVFLFDAATDVFRNPLQGFFGQFTIAPDTTATAPQLVRINPPQFTLLPRNAVFDLEFDEPLDPATVNAANVRLTDGAGAAVEIVVSLRSGGRTIRLAPTAPLTATTTYFPVVTTAVRDEQGTPLLSDISYAVMTGTGLDVTLPAVTAVTPPGGATNVGINALVRVSFSEPVNPLTIGGASIRVSGGAATLMPASISFDSTNTDVTITPLEAMPGTTVMSITIGGVEDWAGNAVTPLSTSFATAPGTDTVSPAVVATSFAIGQTDVPVNSVFTMDFSEPMDPQSISAASMSLVDHATFVAVPATVSLGSDGRTATLAPDAALEVSRGYSLLVSGRDLAGNGLPFAGFFAFSFTTSSFSDTTGPQVVATSPGNGHANVARNARLQALFDETLDPTSLDGVTLTAGGLAVPVSFELSNANRTLTVTPAASLSANTGYVLTIAGVRDTARNAMAGDIVVAFTTGAFFDLGSPAAVSLTPEHGATDVPIAASVEVTFDEAINPLTVLGGTLVLRVTNTGAPVPATIAVSADHRTFTLTPASPLDPATQYTCTLSFGVTDRAGNLLGAAAATTFATVP